MALLSPLSTELWHLRRELSGRLETQATMSVGDVRRIVRQLGEMEAEAARLEGRPDVDVSPEAVRLAQQLQAAGIVG